jgi:hypothetical protein
LAYIRRLKSDSTSLLFANGLCEMTLFDLCVGHCEGGYLEDPGIDGSIILKWIYEKWDVGA